ncbi:hypothetical protein EVAR_101093_1 [Eumeta japonica]|uniref:TROVE domain-containing protein n=1 Tax=Eumeta variegata TaxID=151549 RepID=A0A4C1SHE2_EUMVA|nr:hypothetical protein EVAR_101093_1 [Eumeta japonica]
MGELQIHPDLFKHLIRFLHLGSERPIYSPGYWSFKKFLLELRVIDIILHQDNNNTEVVKVIVNTFKEGFFTRHETIVFALCKCIALGSNKVREACYNAVPEICRTSEELMLFVKFRRVLRRSGAGQGWCNSIKNWYNSKEPIELAKEFVREKGHHGISHLSLLKKSHIKIPSEDVPRDAVVKCAILGLQRTKQLLGEKEEAGEILKYIEIVETLKHCEDPLVASEMISCYKITIDYIPTHLLIFPEVWNAILPQMSLSNILNNLLRIHNLGFLASDSSTANMMIILLNNKDLINKSNLTPLAVFIALNNYAKETGPIKFKAMNSAATQSEHGHAEQMFDPALGIWKWVVTPHPKQVKYCGIERPPNRDIITALYNLLNETWLLAPSLGVQYLITIDMREHMFKGKHFCKSHTSTHSNQHDDNLQQPSTSSGSNGNNDNPDKIGKKHILANCFYDKNVVPGHAAIVIASHILKRERDVMIATFTDEGIQTIELDRNLDIFEVENILKSARKGKVQLDAPIKWAMETNKKIDVFINMIDRSTRYMELNKGARGGRGPGGYYGPPPFSPNLIDHCPARALEKYRLRCNKHDSKLIVMSLASHRICTSGDRHSGILDIIGIDEYVPKVLDAFIKGKFF